MNITSSDIEHAASAAPECMVLVGEDGTLTLDPTSDDIGTYQAPGRWPRYLCRAGTVHGMVARDGTTMTAARLSSLADRQFARLRPRS